jgi:hypothetical protein
MFLTMTLGVVGSRSLALEALRALRPGVTPSG